MADEQSPGGKKKTNPAVIIGPAVAIGAALFAVFISTSNKDKTSAPPATQEAAQSQAAGGDPVAQPAQFGETDLAAPTPPTPPWRPWGWCPRRPR